VAAAEHLQLVAGPLHNVFLQVAGPTGDLEDPGMPCCGLRVVSVDGSVTDAPDSPANGRYFGRPSNQARDGAFPIRGSFGWRGGVQ
jgi:hypothetical protein